MPQRAATIVSLPMAFEVVKAMQGDNLEWGEDYRPLARQAVAEIIEDEMAQAVDRYLDQLSLEDGPDRRNGYYPRHLLTTLGDIELAADKALQPGLGATRLCPAGGGDRSGDARRLRARALHPQGRRDAACHPRPEGQRHHREPGRQDPRCGGLSLPPPVTQQPLQGADA